MDRRENRDNRVSLDFQVSLISCRKAGLWFIYEGKNVVGCPFN